MGVWPPDSECCPHSGHTAPSGSLLSGCFLACPSQLQVAPEEGGGRERGGREGGREKGTDGGRGRDGQRGRDGGRGREGGRRGGTEGGEGREGEERDGRRGREREEGGKRGGGGTKIGGRGT